MAKSRISKKKTGVETNNTKPKSDKIQVNLANAPLITVKMLETINNNIVALTAYLKSRDIDNGRLK